MRAIAIGRKQCQCGAGEGDEPGGLRGHAGLVLDRLLLPIGQPESRSQEALPTTPRCECRTRAAARLAWRNRATMPPPPRPAWRIAAHRLRPGVAPEWRAGARRDSAH